MRGLNFVLALKLNDNVKSSNLYVAFVIDIGLKIQVKCCVPIYLQRNIFLCAERRSLLRLESRRIFLKSLNKSFCSRSMWLICTSKINIEQRQRHFNFSQCTSICWSASRLTKCSWIPVVCIYGMLPTWSTQPIYWLKQYPILLNTIIIIGISFLFHIFTLILPCRV